VPPPPTQPLIEAARRVATEVLEPAAAQVDATEVPRSHLKALADAGLLGLFAPVSVGGAGASAAVFREVAELLAGADAATWFVQAQHQSVVRMLAAGASPAAAKYLPRLVSGELVAGFAFSHLRRYPDRPVTARRVDGGWRLDGVAPWYTGWGLNDLAFLSGVTDDGEVVFGAVPAVDGGGLAMKTRLRTAALDAALTVVLSLENVVIADDDVALRQPHAEWLAGDAVVANANAAIFGVARSAVALLREVGDARHEEATIEAAAIFDAELVDVRARCYALADEVPATEAMEERLDRRAEALELLIAVTSALVAAHAGQGMALSSAAQRKAREALFLTVQAQTGPAREATLRRWSASANARASERATARGTTRAPARERGRA
jgi:alkylation response protein AidB-like acyl-CoA dehydrogenase